MPRKALSGSDRSRSSSRLHARGGPLAVEIAAAGLARLIAASADGRAAVENCRVVASSQKDSSPPPDRLDPAAGLPLSVPTGRRAESATE